VPVLTPRQPTVHLELPETWVRVPLAADGDRNGQRRLLTDWCGGSPPDALVSRLVRQSRAAHRDGLSFAAVLLATVDGMPVGLDRVTLSAALTVGFRPLPGASQDASVAAEGLLRVRRASAGPATRTELVGLARDPDRPALLVQEAVTTARCEVLWLVPGTDRLAGVAATSQDRALAPALARVALAAAASLTLS